MPLVNPTASATWSSISGKPAVVASGADETAARVSIKIYVVGPATDVSGYPANSIILRTTT